MVKKIIANLLFMICILMLYVTRFYQLCTAEDLGRFGKVYEIIEPDMLHIIKKRAKQLVDHGKWQKIQQDAIIKAKNHILHPKPIMQISDAVENRVFYYDPSFMLQKDIKDHRQKIIARAGVYNPLDTQSFNLELLFINGENEDQVKWAVDIYKNSDKKVKIILTAGSFIELSRLHKIWFFYDQHGRYVNQLGIQHVPAKVAQEKNMLRIEELALH